MEMIDSGKYGLISIHAPRAGSDSESHFAIHTFPISIHAPRAGSDAIYLPCKPCATYFNPRSPCGERRRKSRTFGDVIPFQSTLPVRGATSHGGFCRLAVAYFNPRSPCGERQCGIIYTVKGREFQSTLPVRGATCAERKRSNWSRDFNPRSPCGERPSIKDSIWSLTLISIHAPRAGSDSNGT